MRLRTRVVPRASITPARADEMWALMNLCYEGSTRARFDADLAGKQHVILLETGAGALVGFSTVRMAEERHDGRPVDVVFSGDTVLHPEHWGGKALKLAFTRFVLGRRLRRPWRPLFWLLLSGGYKTYLLMMNNLPRAHPRHDRAAPDGWPAFLADLGARWFGAEYDHRAGIVRWAAQHYTVRRGIAPVDRATALHPHVAFFCARNPGHADGDELVCLGELRLRDLALVLVRLGLRRASRVTRRALAVVWRQA